MIYDTQWLKDINDEQIIGKFDTESILKVDEETTDDIFRKIKWYQDELHRLQEQITDQLSFIDILKTEVDNCQLLINNYYNIIKEDWQYVGNHKFIKKNKNYTCQ